jgi:hypothetical protein
VAGALLAGSVIGPPLAQAVTASMVRIESGHNTNLAVVSSKGKLSVDAGLATTPAGQVKTTLASPADTVVITGIVSGKDCTDKFASFYAVPQGKALIITSVTFFHATTGTGPSHDLFLYAGIAANQCEKFLATSATTADYASDHQDFSPGIAVPTGGLLTLDPDFAVPNDTGYVLVYGYLVPAWAVPAGILNSARTHRND